MTLTNGIDKRRGMTFLEVTISSMLVGVLIVGAMRASASATAAGLRSQHRVQAAQFARALQCEITSLPYADPNEAAGFGPEGPEALATFRAQFDDVDDFHGWTESPIVDRLGNAIAGVPNWERSVNVALVDPLDLSSASATDQAIKRITVSVSQVSPPKLLAESTGYQTAAWSEISQRRNATQKRFAGNRAPLARINASTLYGSSPLVVHFDSTASADPDGDSVFVQWTFGDGATSSATSPTHSFTNTSDRDQAFEVQLNVTDSLGATSRATLHVVVLPIE